MTPFASDIMDSLSNVNYNGDIDKFVSDFDKAIVSVLDTHTPLSSSSKPKRHKPKWYNDLIDKARRERRRAERKWRKTR